jgi:hypothetical protein
VKVAMAQSTGGTIESSLRKDRRTKNQDRAEYYIELKPRLYHLNAATQCNSDPHRIDKQEQ